VCGIFLAVVLRGFAAAEAGLAWIGANLGKRRGSKPQRGMRASSLQTPTTAVVGGVGAHPRTTQGAIEEAGRADVERICGRPRQNAGRKPRRRVQPQPRCTMPTA
jgi:hypothetical protein